MKKALICIILFFTFSLSFVKADQLAVLTLEQAQKAVKQLRAEESVVLWCACCRGDEKKYVIITKVYMEKDKNSDYYSVLIDGVTPDGEIINKEYLDLAYVHVKKKKNKDVYMSLGKKLKFDCDPCTKPFVFVGG